MKSRLLIAAFTLALAVAPFVRAQQSDAPPAGQGVPSESVPEVHGGWPTPEEAVAKMNDKLNLTDDQKAKITPIIADRQTRMRAVMSDTSGRRIQKARKAKSILVDSDKKIEAVLTKEQKNTYEQMKQEMHKQLRSRMQVRNSGMD